mmetsp:Transcript_160164/g.282492  ORF Transcript_160164/g.282492 Transcript_160164/m.282492 type:complete len:417 (+) Transcript_160164:65-1315(+)
MRLLVPLLGLSLACTLGVLLAGCGHRWYDNDIADNDCVTPRPDDLVVRLEIHSKRGQYVTCESGPFLQNGQVVFRPRGTSTNRQDFIFRQTQKGTSTFECVCIAQYSRSNSGHYLSYSGALVYEDKYDCSDDSHSCDWKYEYDFVKDKVDMADADTADGAKWWTFKTLPGPWYDGWRYLGEWGAVSAYSHDDGSGRQWWKLTPANPSTQVRIVTIEYPTLSTAVLLSKPEEVGMFEYCNEGSETRSYASRTEEATYETEVKDCFTLTLTASMSMEGALGIPKPPVKIASDNSKPDIPKAASDKSKLKLTAVASNENCWSKTHKSTVTLTYPSVSLPAHSRVTYSFITTRGVLPNLPFSAEVEVTRRNGEKFVEKSQGFYTGVAYSGMMEVWGEQEDGVYSCTSPRPAATTNEKLFM